MAMREYSSDEDDIMPELGEVEYGEKWISAEVEGVFFLYCCATYKPFQVACKYMLFFFVFNGLDKKL